MFFLQLDYGFSTFEFSANNGMTWQISFQYSSTEPIARKFLINRVYCQKWATANDFRRARL